MFFRETFEEPRTKLNVEFDVNTLEELNLVIAHLENSRKLFPQPPEDKCADICAHLGE